MSWRTWEPLPPPFAGAGTCVVRPSPESDVDIHKLRHRAEALCSSAQRMHKHAAGAPRVAGG